MIINKPGVAKALQNAKDDLWREYLKDQGGSCSWTISTKLRVKKAFYEALDTGMELQRAVDLDTSSLESSLSSGG